MERTFKLAQLLSIAIGILVSSLLIAGYVYHLGYIHSFGLDAAIIYKSLPDMITEGWYLTIQIVLWMVDIWWVFIVALILYAGLILGISYGVTYLKTKGKLEHVEEITFENQGRLTFGLTEWIWKIFWETMNEGLTWFLHIPLAVLTVLFLLALWPYQQGRDDGLKQIAQHQEYGCIAKDSLPDMTQCIYIFDNSKSNSDELVAQGILVAADKQRLALFNDNKIEIWPRKVDYKIVHNYRSKEKKQAENSNKHIKKQ
ncbi:MAG: hypothetical protein HRT92_10370 [Piscirickettsiaceae bacterium]|nr:hypothetical protein [Piscirickettsiaceae bacterium]